MGYTIIILLAFASSYYAEKKNNKKMVFLLALAISLLCGLRGPQIGVDTRSYYNYFLNVQYSGYSFGTDTGFSFICKILLELFNKPEILILIFAIITNFLIIYRLWSFRNIASFSTMVLVYLVFQYPYTFNIIRQYLAIAIIFWASKFIEREQNWKYILCNIIATTIHASAIIGFGYLLLIQGSKAKKKKYKIFKYGLAIVVAILSVIVMHGKMGKYLVYFNNSTYFEFSLLTVYKIICVLIILAFSKANLNKKFSITKSKEYIPLNKSIAILYLVGLLIGSMGMFFQYMNRIGFYFSVFEMPFWGQVTKSINGPNRRFYKLLLYIIIVYYYIMTLVTNVNGILNYTTFFN